MGFVWVVRETPHFVRSDINSCLCRCTLNDMIDLTSLRASGASVAISDMAVMRTERETPHFVRSDINFLFVLLWSE